MEAIFQTSSNGNVKQLCKSCQLERRAKPSEFVSCPDSYIKSLISGTEAFGEIQNISLQNARLCSEFVYFISHWIKASCAANRVVSVGRLNWQKLFTDACNQITIFQLRPHGLHLNAICLDVHGTLEPYIMSLVLFMRLEIAPCKVLLPLLAAGLRLKGTICRHAVCGVLDLITPAITGRAVRPWYVTPLLHGPRCGQNRMWRNLEGPSMLYHLERRESVLHPTPGECVISFWSEA